PRLPIRNVCATSAANICVATMIAKTAATIDPHNTASRPARPCSISEACALSPLLPTFKTSAHATPSGYGRSELVTNARRSGIEVEKVRPALRPKYTLAAVKTNVMMIPMISPRTVSSLRIFAVMLADRRERRIVWNRRKGQDDITLAGLEYCNVSEPFRMRADEVVAN